MSGAATLSATSDSPITTANVIEDFRPLARCLEWRVSELYWREHGVQPFIQREVPFLINNSGRLSDSAARLLFTSCLESPPEGHITVLEYGAGCGLFARLFLDSFRSLCAVQGRDFYDRLDMRVTDASPATIRQWRERGIFSEHDGHITTEVLGALDDLPVKNVRAAFCNYLLDSLPAALVRTTTPGVYEQLCVRTCLVQDENVLRAYTPFTLDDFRRKTASSDPRELVDLFPLLALFEYEYAFRSDGAANVPGIVDALQAEPARPVLLNFGALQCLERLASRLSPDGFILLNDYGSTRPDDSKDFLRSERFGKTSAMRVNFPLIARTLQRQALTVTTPVDDEKRSVHARLITRHLLTSMAETFEREFGASGTRHLESLTDETRKQLSAGGRADATDWCRSAISRSPHDWLLLGDVAELFRHDLREPEVGLPFVRAAIELNPWYSPWLWNILGDCFYDLKRFDEAHEAYLQGQKIDPQDPHINLNLAYTFIRAGDCGSALQAIGRGFAGDVTGGLRDDLLKMQAHALLVLTMRRTREKARPGWVLNDGSASERDEAVA